MTRLLEFIFHGCEILTKPSNLGVLLKISRLCSIKKIWGSSDLSGEVLTGFVSSGANCFQVERF